MLKFPLKSLKKYLDIAVPREDITNALDNLGLEVEKFYNPSQKLQNIIVGQIRALSKHPNADRLTLCDVDDGHSALRVVCGAQNLRPDMKVALAPAGSSVPLNNMVIKKSKIRGEESNGMLCSAEELELTGLFNVDGIIKLPEDFTTGKRLIDELGIDDTIIEVAITPNRGDCASIFGIARDLAAANIGTLKQPDIRSLDFLKDVRIQIDERHAPLLSLALINNITNINTPLWLKVELWQSGFKSISAPVDIANYVMLQYGQPLHVYDADKINGRVLHVAITSKESDFLALNDIRYKLKPNIPVIQDDSASITAIAGIIGSKDTAHSANTRNIIIEAAWFNPQSVAVSGGSTGIRTNALYNFERGVDVNFTKSALSYAVQLILTICGGSLQSAQFNEHSRAEPAKAVNYDREEMKKFLGQEIDRAISDEIIKKLGFVTGGHDGKVFLPAWRFDINSSHALYGEIARIYGYAKINSNNAPQGINLIAAKKHQAKRFELAAKIRKILTLRGLREVITWSFSSLAQNAQFDDGPSLTLVNPLNQEMSEMRNSIIPNLLQAAVSNQNHGVHNIAIFELGSVYNKNSHNNDPWAIENTVITGLLKGRAVEQNIYSNERMYDIFDAKAHIIKTLEWLNIESFTINPLTQRGLCSAASIDLNDKRLGFFGKITPTIAAQYKTEEAVYVFTLFIEQLVNILEDKKQSNRRPISVPRFQAIFRDFNFIADATVMPSDIESAIRKADSQNVIQSIKLFDLYQNEDHKQNNKKSMCFRITIQPKEKTPTDQELREISNIIISKVETECHAFIRSESK